METQLKGETNEVKQIVTPDRLVEGYIRKQCHVIIEVYRISARIQLINLVVQLLGDIHNVPIALDIGNRSHILDIVDNARVRVQCTSCGYVDWQCIVPRYRVAQKPTVSLYVRTYLHRHTYIQTYMHTCILVHMHD